MSQVANVAKGLQLTGKLIILLVVLGLCTLCLVCGIVGLFLNGSGPRTADEYFKQYGGNRDIYVQILASTDCSWLDQTAARASANHDAAQPGSRESNWTMGYLLAADARAKAAGCYSPAPPPTPALDVLPTITAGLRLSPVPNDTRAPPVVSATYILLPSVTLLPSITVPPTYTPVTLNSSSGPLTIGSNCACTGNIYNCTDFSSHAEAQACYDRCVSLGVGDIHKLDNDGNKLACEGLP